MKSTPYSQDCVASLTRHVSVRQLAVRVTLATALDCCVPVLWQYHTLAGAVQLVDCLKNCAAGGASLVALQTCSMPRPTTRRCTTSSAAQPPSTAWGSGIQAVASFTRYCTNQAGSCSLHDCPACPSTSCLAPVTTLQMHASLRGLPHGCSRQLQYMHPVSLVQSVVLMPASRGRPRSSERGRGHSISSRLMCDGSFIRLSKIQKQMCMRVVNVETAGPGRQSRRQSFGSECWIVSIASQEGLAWTEVSMTPS